LEEHFSCQICLDVVEDPIMCNWCESLFCRECELQYQRRDTKCPSCRAEFVEGRLSRLVRNSLNQKEFNCNKCKQVFTYENRKRHAENECRFVTCPGCGSSVKYDDMRSHLLEACEGVNLLSRMGATPKVQIINDEACD